MTSVHVIPTKAGLWRVATMTPARLDRWQRAYDAWFRRVGCRFAANPRMWVL